MEAADLGKALREAMGTLARSVTVVTAEHAGVRHAMAATAVSEVSLDPPSMLVCVNRERGLCDLLAEGSVFAINVLADEHEEVSIACGGARHGEERFAVGRWRHSASGDAPTLENACASISMRVVNHLDHGSHRIVIGNVEAVVANPAARPLLYHDRRYARLAS